MKNKAVNINPGSPEAVKRGCKCPEIDNGYGKGYIGGRYDPETGQVMYVTSSACPLHWEN